MTVKVFPLCGQREIIQRHPSTSVYSTTVVQLLFHDLANIKYFKREMKAVLKQIIIAFFSCLVSFFLFFALLAVKSLISPQTELELTASLGHHKTR